MMLTKLQTVIGVILKTDQRLIYRQSTVIVVFGDIFLRDNSLYYEGKKLKVY
jgi:hypothetical protein